MNTLISFISAKTYRYIAKPLLFRHSPDAVHTGMVRLTKIVQKNGILRRLVHGVWAYENPAFLSQRVAGIRFRNPVGLSAGFDKNFELPPMLRSIGFGFMEGGSLTFAQCDGNPRPWFYRLPKSKSLVVHAGLANDGVEAIIARLGTYPRATFKDFPLNISVAKTNSPGTCDDTAAIADYVGSLRLLQKHSLGDMLTLNISCPNTYGGEPFTTPERLDSLLSAVDELHLAQPVFVKMPHDCTWAQAKKLLKVIDAHAITGVTISNLAKQRNKLAIADSLPKSVPGGLSGKPTWQQSNELIRQTRRAYGDRFVIIGVGGVFSAEDAYAKIRLGANVVELITGMIFEGPQLIGQINRGLVRLLKADGYTNISQAVGVDAAK